MAMNPGDPVNAGDIKVPTGVGWTALLAAYGRAQESRKSDRRFNDPLAAAFIEAIAGEATYDAEKLPRMGPAVDDGSSAYWHGSQFYFAQRTPFYDQRVLHATGAGCRQVVLLGAGLDSRAFRLSLPENTTVFELAQASVLDFKQAVLDRKDALPVCRRVPLPVDLRADWPRVLSAAGFDASLPAVWLAEGLLMYLSRAEADQFLDKITALSAPGSQIVAEYFSKAWEDSDFANEASDAQVQAGSHREVAGRAAK